MDRNRVIRREILSLFKNNAKRAFRPKEVAKKLGYSDNQDYKTCRAVLEEMVDRGQIARIKGNQFAYRPSSSRLEGKLSVHQAGYGFVRVEGYEDDFFVRSRRMNTALDGDTVRIGLAARQEKGQRQQAEVLEVLKRGRTSAVGTFQHSGSFAVVIPDDRRLTHDIYVDLDSVGEAVDGDKVQVSIDAFEHRGAAPRGRILKIIGAADDPAIQTIALALSAGIEVDFEEDVLLEARSEVLDLSDHEVSRRADFRNRSVFTIDPVDARDFDDALHIHSLGNGQVEVGIHIADVSHYVRPGTAIDRAAAARATSVYLVDRVIPMLPEELSNELCSLKPNEDRLAFSCIVNLDSNAKVLKFYMTESVIRSAHRLSYEDAQEIMLGEGAGHPLEKNIALLNDLAKKMRKSRFENGSIDFGVREVRIELDESSRPIRIVPRERRDSHRLVEEFMLLANRLVAKEYGLEPHTFVFRVHDPPDKDRITQLANYVGAFGHELRHDSGQVSPKALNDLLKSVANKPESAVIEQAALRSMSRARYDTNNRGHYGLAADYYTHYTSPIRRYPDLMVHRLIKARLAGKTEPKREQLDDLVQHCSEREVVATEAERESVRLKKVEYVLNHVGEEYGGVISGVSKFGVYIELEDLLVEGMVHVRDMDDDYYEYDEASFSLVGSRTGRRYRPGIKVRVLIAGASLENREIDFSFV